MLGVIAIIIPSVVLGALLAYGWYIHKNLKLDSNDDFDYYVTDRTPTLAEVFSNYKLTLDSFDLLDRSEYYINARDICKENWNRQMGSLSDKQRAWIGNVLNDLVMVSK
jgi:hypothetical protein